MSVVLMADGATLPGSVLAMARRASGDADLEKVGLLQSGRRRDLHLRITQLMALGAVSQTRLQEVRSV